MTSYRHETDYRDTTTRKSDKKLFEEDASKFNWVTRSSYDRDTIGPAQRVLNSLSANYNYSKSAETTDLGFWKLGKNVATFRKLKAELEQIEDLRKQEKISAPEEARLVQSVLKDSQYYPAPSSGDSLGDYKNAKNKVEHLFKHEYAKDIELARTLVGWKLTEMNGGAKVANQIETLDSKAFPRDNTTRYNHNDTSLYGEEELYQYDSHINTLASPKEEKGKQETVVNSAEQKLADRRAKCLGFKDLADLQNKFSRSSSRTLETPVSGVSFGPS